MISGVSLGQEIMTCFKLGRIDLFKFEFVSTAQIEKLLTIEQFFRLFWTLLSDFCQFFEYPWGFLSDLELDIIF